MYSFKRWREKYGRITVRSLWDLFMVWVVIINLCLILFDLTYLWLRPTYFTYLPLITRIWDPVLGIEPHPLTEELVEKTEKLSQLDPYSEILAETLREIRDLTLRVFLENPFERSGQTANLDAIKRSMASETGQPPTHLKNPKVLFAVADDYWSGPPDLLRHRFSVFDQQILLNVNHEISRHKITNLNC